MTDYEIITQETINKEANPPKIKDLDSSIHSSLEKSEKFEKSGKSSLNLENSEYFERSQEEIIVSQVQDILKKQGDFKDLEGEITQELFLKVFKKHYFFTLFGIFSCYHVLISLINYFKDKA